MWGGSHVRVRTPGMMMMSFSVRYMNWIVGSRTCRGCQNTHQVFQPVLQDCWVHRCLLSKTQTCFGKLGTACDTARGVLGSCGAAELQVSLSFPSMIDYSFFEGVNSSVGFTSSDSVSSPQLHCTVRSLKKPNWLSPLGMSGKYPLY